MAAFVLPFERPVVDLVEKVRELRALAASDQRFEPELARLEEKTSRLAREIFADLTPMQKVQISRHASRPYTLDYVKRLFTDAYARLVAMKLFSYRAVYYGARCLIQHASGPTPSHHVAAASPCGRNFFSADPSRPN